MREKWVESISILSLLAILVAIILTIVGTFKMHEAIVRGKAMREKCGTEHYEAETVRYQVYDKWETEGKKLFNVSSIFTLVVIHVVLAIYIVIVGLDSQPLLEKSPFWGMIVALVIAYALNVYVGTGLLKPDSGIKLYAKVEDEPKLATRIIGVVVMVAFILFLPFAVFLPEKWRKIDSVKKSIYEYDALFDKHSLVYKTGWTLIRIVITVAVINLIFASYVGKGIYDNYYDPSEPNQLATGQLNELIKAEIIKVKDSGASYVLEKKDGETKPIYSSNSYYLYKSIYRGIHDIDKPENGVDEGTLKNTASTVYQPYFKYLKHSKDVNDLLSEFNTNNADYTTLFTSLPNKEAKMIQPIKTVFNTTISIVITLVVVPLYYYFHSQYKANTSRLLFNMGLAIVVLLLFSFFYVIMTQSLIS